MPRADDLPSFKVETIETALPVQSARHQGLRRGGRDRLAAGGDQRDHRRARPRGCRHAGDPAGRLARRAEGRDEARRRMIGRARRPPAATASPPFQEISPCTLSPIIDPTSVADARRRARARRRQAARRRPDPAADDETAARLARRAHRSRQDRGTRRHRREGDAHRHRRDDASCRRRDSAVVKPAIPALAALAGGIGDPAVRNRGTIGGSLANNDPAADYPAAALALGATIVTNKRRDRGRTITSRACSRRRSEADEIITKVQLPDPGEGGLREVPQSRLALCAGRRVRRQDGGRRARRRDRRGRKRRVPRHGDRGRR